MVEYEKGVLTGLFDDVKTTNIYDNKRKCVVKYYEVAMSFDIETTSTYLDDGSKFAFMYIWSFAVGGFSFYGRDWDGFVSFLTDLKKYLELSDDVRVLVYVHNLPYEFQFMRKYLTWQNVFAVDERKVVKAVTNGVEFRDSYILSGYSLAKVADNLVSHDIKKLDGDLDYSLLRHSKTLLTEKEMAYCENDVLIVTAYVQEQIEQYGSVTRIPLTNTGRVRKFVRDNCYSKQKGKSQGVGKRYRGLMSELELDMGSYIYSKAAFQGGFVHASLQHVGKTLKDVHSIDFNSSYPYCMVSEKYPMSRPYYSECADELLNSECSMFRVKFYNLQSKFLYDGYISKHKCKGENMVVQNGRVYAANYLDTVITNIDFEIIRKVYTWEMMDVIKGYYFYTQYLPKTVIDSILKLYNDKTLLKGVEGKEVEYLLSKGMLNSVYGMCVTDIIRDKYIYDGEWKVERPSTSEMSETLEKNNKSRMRFLYYPWGVFVTAYARRNLWDGILRIEKDYVYSDTDSIKFFNYDRYVDWIDGYNENCSEKLMKMCSFRKVDFRLCEPNGRLLGVFDYEGKSDYFKTLGAKRYLTYSKKEGYKLTVAGLGKKDGMDYIMERGRNVDGVFSMFDDGLVIPPESTGKKTHTYIDGMVEDDVMDCNGDVSHVSQLSSIHLSDCGFDMGVDSGFIDFFHAFQNGYVSKGGYV